MARRLPGPAMPGNGKRLLYYLLAILVAVGLAYGIYNHYHHKKATIPAVSVGTDLTPTQIATQQNSVAANALSQKDYANAVNGYEAASATAFDNKNYVAARNYLQTCIKNVPDQYVTWDVYQSLALIAKQLNDTQLEKSSLQTSIDKASVAGSGAPDQTIALMKQNLQAIK